MKTYLIIKERKIYKITRRDIIMFYFCFILLCVAVLIMCFADTKMQKAIETLQTENAILGTLVRYHHDEIVVIRKKMALLEYDIPDSSDLFFYHDQQRIDRWRRAENEWYKLTRR